MRFEAKHNYFKSLANNLGNYKNLPKTMATRHQRLMCYNLANNKMFSNFYHEDSVTTGIGNFMHENNYMAILHACTMYFSYHKDVDCMFIHSYQHGHCTV